MGGFPTCDNHAVKCQTVRTDRPRVEYRGRMVRLCEPCAYAKIDGKRLWLDDKYDAEAAKAELANLPEFEQAEARFENWNRKNIQIQIEFCKLADRARLGRQRFSAWAICNVLRWNRAIETPDGEDFKIPNGFIGFLARRYMELDPETRGGFFDIRPMKGEDFERTKRRCGIK